MTLAHDGSNLSDALETHLPEACRISLYSFAAELKSSLKEPATSHCFVAIQDDVIIYAIEVIVYSRPHLTTLYVSKVDSTGCHDSTRSPITGLTQAVLSHLTRAQAGPVRLCLFARSQPQYIFPFSSKNVGKHVLDDSKLVKWWIKLCEYLRSTIAPQMGEGYLLIPGEEQIVSKRRLQSMQQWHIGHPYDPAKLASEAIIAFPDDPKARFLEEIKSNKEDKSMTVALFWELMGYRQEMSDGHAIGFLVLELDVMQKDTTTEVDHGNVTYKSYKKSFELLQSSTFADRAETKASTSSWLKQIDTNLHVLDIVGKCQMRNKSIDTTRDTASTKRDNAEMAVTILLPRKKKKKEPPTEGT